MLFYAPDMEAYGVARGFYLDYEKLPGKIVTEPKRLAKEALQALSENGAGAAGRKMPASGRDTAADAEGVEAVQAFYETYMSGCDGKVTKRLADRMGA